MTPPKGAWERGLRTVAIQTLAGVNALAIVWFLGVVVYFFWPIRPMFVSSLGVPTRSTFTWGRDPIEVMRSFCATRSRWVEISSEIYNTATDRSLIEAQPRRRYVEQGCVTEETFPVRIPAGVVLEPGTYVLKTRVRILPGHLLERETTETVPDVPFTVVWHK